MRALSPVTQLSILQVCCFVCPLNAGEPQEADTLMSTTIDKQLVESFTSAFWKEKKEHL